MKQVIMFTGLLCLALPPEPCLAQDGKDKLTDAGRAAELWRSARSI